MSLLQWVGRLLARDSAGRQRLRRLAERLRRPWWLVGLLPLQPFSRDYGYSRGQVIDRYYIERFLAQHAADVAGRVLEVADDRYTRRFGGDAVTQADVLHVDAGMAGVTLVADLSHAPQIESASFDCVILTQTLQYIPDIAAAVREVHRILKPGGVALVTAPGITRTHADDEAAWGEQWRLTARAARRLFEPPFDPGDVEVTTYGNVMAASSFLYGLAVEDVRRRDLDVRDPDYEVIVAVRAVKRP